MEHPSKIEEKVVQSQPSIPDWDRLQGKVRRLRGNQQRQFKHVRRHFYIDPKFGDVYFTLREAQCMAQLMRGKTVKAVAQFLGLSPRNVEYYLKNMKAKLKCHSKSELMQVIADTQFMALIGSF